MIKTNIEQNVLFIELNNGPVNVLNEAVLNQIIGAIEEIGFGNDVKVIVIKGMRNVFQLEQILNHSLELSKHERLNLASTSANYLD